MSQRRVGPIFPMPSSSREIINELYDGYLDTYTQRHLLPISGAGLGAVGALPATVKLLAPIQIIGELAKITSQQQAVLTNAMNLAAYITANVASIDQTKSAKIANDARGLNTLVQNCNNAFNSFYIYVQRNTNRGPRDQQAKLDTIKQSVRSPAVSSVQIPISALENSNQFVKNLKGALRTIAAALRECAKNITIKSTGAPQTSGMTPYEVKISLNTTEPFNNAINSFRAALNSVLRYEERVSSAAIRAMQTLAPQKSAPLYTAPIISPTTTRSVSPTTSSPSFSPPNLNLSTSGGGLSVSANTNTTVSTVSTTTTTTPTLTIPSISPTTTDFTKTLSTLATQTASPSPLVTSNITVQEVMARQPSSFSESEGSEPSSISDDRVLPSSEETTPAEFITTEDGAEYIVLANGFIVDPSTNAIVGRIEGDEIVMLRAFEVPRSIVDDSETAGSEATAIVYIGDMNAGEAFDETNSPITASQLSRLVQYLSPLEATPDVDESEQRYGVVSTREELPEIEVAKEPIEEIVKKPLETKPAKKITENVEVKDFSASDMSGNTKIILTVGGVVAVGGLLWFMTRKPQQK